MSTTADVIAMLLQQNQALMDIIKQQHDVIAMLLQQNQALMDIIKQQQGVNPVVPVNRVVVPVGLAKRQGGVVPVNRVPQTKKTSVSTSVAGLRYDEDAYVIIDAIEVPSDSTDTGVKPFTVKCHTCDNVASIDPRMIGELAVQRGESKCKYVNIRCPNEECTAPEEFLQIHQCFFKTGDSSHPTGDVCGRPWFFKFPFPRRHYCAIHHKQIVKTHTNHAHPTVAQQQNSQPKLNESPVLED